MVGAKILAVPVFSYQQTLYGYKLTHRIQFYNKMSTDQTSYFIQFPNHLNREEASYFGKLRKLEKIIQTKYKNHKNHKNIGGVGSWQGRINNFIIHKFVLATKYNIIHMEELCLEELEENTHCAEVFYLYLRHSPCTQCLVKIAGWAERNLEKKLILGFSVTKSQDTENLICFMKDNKSNLVVFDLGQKRICKAGVGRRSKNSESRAFSKDLAGMTAWEESAGQRAQRFTEAPTALKTEKKTKNLQSHHKEKIFPTFPQYISI